MKIKLLRAEKRQKKRLHRTRMKVSGKSVIALQRTIGEKAKKSRD